MTDTVSELLAQPPQKTAKVLITLRLDADVVAWAKSWGPGYQKKINNLLRALMEQQRKESSASV